ncbi:hypothetical protein ACQCVH_20700 [Bacillus infantis]
MITMKEHHEVLAAYMKAIPLIHSMLPEISIGVADTEEWLAYQARTSD